MSIAFGLGFGAVCKHPIIKEILDVYETLSFYKDDGSLNLIACPHYQTEVLIRHGLVPNNKTQRFDGGIAYSPEFFCPQSNITNRMLYLTDRTYSIHHFTVSWASERDLRIRDRKNLLSKYIPYWLASKIVTFVYRYFVR